MSQDKVGNDDHPPETQAPESAQRRAALVKASSIIWWITGILEGLIGIRVLLKLIAANPGAGFAQFVYAITDVFLAPFRGLTPTLAAGGGVLEISSLIAMVVYALLAWVIVRGVWIIFSRPKVS